MTRANHSSRPRLLSAAIIAVAAAALLGIQALGGLGGPQPVLAALAVSAGGPYTGIVGSPITFTATSSATGASPTYTWSFGDGSFGAGVTTTHTYATAGAFPVTVTVVDGGAGSSGGSGSASTTATVTGGALTVSAGGPYSGTVGTPILFTATATGAVSPVYTWTFGDGTSGNGQSTFHTYATAGTFPVTVSVVDASTGATGSSTTTATVGSSGVITGGIAGGPYSGVVGGAITFSASTPAGYTSPIFSWNFGDGTTGTGQIITHVYTTAGTFPVTLTVTNAITGTTTSASTTATVSGNTSCVAGFVTAACTGLNGCGIYGGVCPGLGAGCYASVACGLGGYGLGAYGGAYGSYGLGCTSGTGGCPVGVNCVPVSANQVNCTPVATTIAPATVAATTTAPVTVLSVTPGTTTTAAAAPAGISVTYSAGWSIIAGPSGTVVSTAADTPLYTFQAGDTNYETVSANTPLAAGKGYWAYLPAAGTSTIPVTTTNSTTVSLPAGQWVMIGNPGDTAATVSGADTVMVYDPTSGSYTPSTQLGPGQGAWALSNNGGTATITAGS